MSSLDEIKTIRVQQHSSSEQVLKSQRSYGNRRYGVTAIIATELRQSSLRSYGNRRYETDGYGCSPTP
ncbi:hypothetical protein [Prevotella nigrescens]|uniref:hypothetical protein n=1 Tax=Prevotella nigrescens TaxID=28133 RepID=UPI001C5F6B0C|nr:hypothetical protein [Prevotella nigrescens]MBW4726219.1 hypothetical protein [Prevotella nigrescens]